MSRIPTISIVGRTNVGKSTLFNLLLGKQKAIVEDQPGVTRDRSYAMVKKHHKPFTLIDTGGMVGEEDVDFATAVRTQTDMAIAESDLIVALFDGVTGLHPQDDLVVDFLRRSSKPVIWVINKCEKKETQLRSAEFYALGIEDPICISAAHNQGVDELIRQIWERLEASDDTWLADVPELDDPAIKLAIIGRPNVGKSTLVNKLLGEDRLITSPKAGTTRDQIDVRIKRDAQEFVLVDTAGLRRKSKIPDQSIERYSNLRTLKALAQCDVAIVVIDATAGDPTEQDQKVAALAHERGKALIIVVNKWDAIEKDHKTAKQFKDTLFEQLRFCKYAPVLFVSALTGRRCPSILEKALEVHASAAHRIRTSDLNKLLNQAFTKNPPPVHRGEPVKLFFATQVETNPPTFLLFVNYPRSLPDSYRRYLSNSIREFYAYVGTDLRILFKKRTQKEQDAEAAA